MNDRLYDDDVGAHGTYASAVFIRLSFGCGLGWVAACLSSLLTPKRHQGAGSAWPIRDL